MAKQKVVPISVIIPIYNVSRYLDRCVESLQNQSFIDIEIILVDDESPDECPQMCDRYATGDERIKVIHKQNGGLSDARNAGLEVAIGEYVAFIDGDDYVATDFLKTLYQTCLDENADISCCNFYRVYNDKLIQPSKRAEHESFTNIEAIRDIFTANSSCEVMTWNKLYKKSLFIDNGIRFPVGRVHEDNFTTYKLFYYANKVSFVNKPLYYYIQRTDSIMGEKFNSKRFDIFDVFDEAQSFFDDRRVSFDKELQSMRLLCTLGVYNDYLVAGRSELQNDMRLRAELKKITGVYNSPSITLKHKLLYSLLRVSPRVYGKMRARYERERIKR